MFACFPVFSEENFTYYYAGSYWLSRDRLWHFFLCFMQLKVGERHLRDNERTSSR